MTDGLVIVDKPAGITSHDVVSRVRRLAGTRKVGHAGTLDPMATGVLVLGINRATRLLGHLTLTDKAYSGTICLGVATSTDDAEGEVVSRAETDALTETAVRSGLAAMVGNIQQRPSSVSAIKIDGRRAYDRVRSGEQVELPTRSVRIDAIDVVGIEGALVDIDVRCSSGTYIRAIARDLGEALGVGGHLTRLRRTQVGPFGIGQSRTLEELADEFAVVPIAEAAAATFPSVVLEEAEATAVGYGRPLQRRLADDAEVALFDASGRFLALYRNEGEKARPVAVFL